jgi:hypothetical protein
MSAYSIVRADEVEDFWEASPSAQRGTSTT